VDDIVLIDGVRFTKSPKLDEESGLPLFLLPQEDLEIEDTILSRIKTTDVTDEPVMTTTQVPHIDPVTEEQMAYEATRQEPIYEDVIDEDDNVTQVIVGYETVGTGQFIFCWTTEEIQETNNDGDPLYWTTVEEPIVRYEPQVSVEITEEDERYVEGLEPVYELTPLPENPTTEPTPTPDQVRLVALESAQQELKTKIQLTGEKVDTTTGNLGDFMDFYFSI
jgi:hypothetical protein